MKIKKYKSKNQHSRPVVNHIDLSHATIINGSNNKVDNHVEEKVTQSTELGSAKDKSQSYDWRKTWKIIVVILKVIKTLFFITPPLFNLLC